MNTDANTQAPQEWKKRKGFISTFVGASLFGLVLLSAGKLSAINNKVESQTNTIRTFEAEVHDNDVVFAGGSDSSIEFGIEGHTITGGQSFDGVTFHGNAMTIKAGRKGSTGPAATFSQGLDVTNVLGLHTNAVLTFFPKELNFVVWGDMTFKLASGSYTCPNFRVGQGSSREHGLHHFNNWWVSSDDCISFPKSNTLTCCCGNYWCSPSLLSITPFNNKFAIVITPGDDDHTFTVRPYANP